MGEEFVLCEKVAPLKRKIVHYRSETSEEIIRVVPIVGEVCSQPPLGDGVQDLLLRRSEMRVSVLPKRERHLGLLFGRHEKPFFGDTDEVTVKTGCHGQEVVRIRLFRKQERSLPRSEFEFPHHRINATAIYLV